MDIVRTNKKKKRTPIYIAVGIIALIGITIGLSQMEPAPPGVDGGALYTDTVRQGNMVRQVRGPGTLVPEDIRWISAVTNGRVEQKLVQPGDHVQAGTPLLILSNPDVQLRALDAQRQYANAQSQLISLVSQLETQRLQQESSLAQVKSQYNEAVRAAKLEEELATKGIGSPNAAARARDQLAELKHRVDIAQKTLDVMSGSINAQIQAQKQQVEQLKRTVDFNQMQLESMNVRSEAEGVVQQLDLEMGQWVNAGTTLARVVQPGRLKAVLRIPETQAPM